ncbi:MAG: energy transducer TonB [Sulfurimonas sp.]|nr:energy transducer TonB [Sulfurimonas sp.]
MKLIIILLGLISLLNASIEITQNMKALYKNVELSEVQKDYILDNEDKNINIFKIILKKEVRKFKNLSEKNIVSFMLTPPLGKVTHIKLLKTSGNKKLDKATKRAIEKVAKKLVTPQEIIEIRYIISYRIGKKPSYFNHSDIQEASKEPYYQTISRGTTRFQYQSKEYTRIFKTSKDGFVNLSVSPQLCLERATLLTYKGQRISIKGMYAMSMNEEIPKGKYKILFKTKKTCNVNLEYQ